MDSLDAGNTFDSSFDYTGRRQDRNMEKRLRKTREEGVDYIDLDNPSEELQDNNGCDDGEYLSNLHALRHLKKREQLERAEPSEREGDEAVCRTGRR